MEYSTMLHEALLKADLSLAQVCRRLKKHGANLDPAVLSKMRNGKCAPAKDKVNIALAEVLGVDSKELRLAAARETIPSPLFTLIRDAK